MKERFLNVLKWFFIALGVLFFAQIILFVFIIISANTFKIPDVPDVKIKSQKLNLKEMQKITDYAEDYRKENNKYPKTVDIKLDKNVEYEYSTSNEDNCYKIDLKNKKTNTIKQYQRCNIQKEGMTSASESFSEVKQ